MLEKSLADVLKEDPRQHRQAIFDVEDDEEHTDEATPNAHLDELPGIGNNRR